MNDEISALEHNHTLYLVPLPPDHEVIGSRWVYKIKHNSDDSVERYKARLVAKGYTHVEGVYYKETFFPAAKLVDDNLLADNDLKEIQHLKTSLLEKFLIKDLENLKYFLGIKFSRSRKEIFMSQRKYALDILQDTGLIEARPEKFPMEQNLKLSLTEGEKLNDSSKYRRLIGRLIYFSVTRPDIVYSVRMLSQFMHELRKPHWEAALRVLRYIKGSPGQGLLLPSENILRLQAYENVLTYFGHD